MDKLPEPIDYSDYRGRRNIDEKIDEMISTINEIIEYLKETDLKPQGG